MTENSNPNELRQLLISRISQTDNTDLLQQCLNLLGKTEQDDDAVETITLANQLRQQHTDKQQLLNQAMSHHSNAAAHTESAEEAAEAEADKDTATSTPAATSKLRRRIGMGLLLAFILIGAVWAFGKIRDWWNNDNDQNVLVTTAERFETITVGNVSFKMVYVEGGTFMMGANEAESDECDSDELPAHRVTLSSFMIGETEVTEGLWKAVMGNSPLPYDGDDHPVKKVSWDDCQLFIDSLNKLTGHTFSLPTEAQWEFAARGGNRSSNFKFAGSDDLDQVGWYSANAWDKGKGDPDFGSHAVGMKLPNELGLYDMSGNVWEWCQDSYSTYTDSAQTDPSGPEGDMYSYRVNRGGSWDYIATSSRTPNRRNRTPDFRNFNLGLRLAMTAE